MSETRVVLGASDPEMAAIAELARAAGLNVVQATDIEGHPVTGATAYRAISPRAKRGDIWVECGQHLGRGLTLHGQGCTVIDHHAPGDAGYGRPPAEFLAASSIGQFIVWLISIRRLRWLSWLSAEWHYRDGGVHTDVEWFDGDQRGMLWAPSEREIISCLISRDLPPFGDQKRTDPCFVLTPRGWWANSPCGDETGGPEQAWQLIPQDYVMTAAADHCLAAAYRGECPGVRPEELMGWRAETRAEFQRRPVEAVLADIKAARDVLRTAPRMTEYGGEVADLRDHTPIPELPEATARDGVAFLATLTERGKIKNVLQAASPEQITAWMDEQRTTHGREPYSDPARGFAGVIEP